MAATHPQGRGELQEARSRGGVLAGPELIQARQRIIELETENQVLRQRIESARERLRALSSRLAFLQAEDGAA